MGNTAGAEACFWSDVAPGQRELRSLVVSESYAGVDIAIPLHIWRGAEDGPTVCITAAVHGDEINGTGTIRHILRNNDFILKAGTLVLAPVVNIMGFERHSRYLPDRRDLNRCFPGTRGGSLASRMARTFFDQVTRHCQYGIDLHTAAVRRTNFPNVRADMSDQRLAAFARAFGTELIVDSKGPEGSLRRSACEIGCATLILEAGEIWKVEPGYVEYALRGIGNVLRFLKMIEGEIDEPAYRVETDATKWVRARAGGFLEFHIAPGDIVLANEPIATNTSLTGKEHNVVTAPRDGIVLGMTTIPSVAPGDPVCNLAYPTKGTLAEVRRIVKRLSTDSLHERMRDDLARSMHVRESS